MRVRSIRQIAPRDSEIDLRHATDTTLAQPRTVVSEVEAAKYIGMSAAWLKKSRTRRFRSVMDAPPFIRAGVKRIVYRIEDLDAWQERHLEHVGPERAVDSDNSPADKDGTISV